MDTEKRLLLAIALSLLVITTWSLLVSKLQPIKKQEVTKQTIVATDSKATLLSSLALSWQETSIEALPLPLKDEEVLFSLPYATIKEVIFKEYQNYKFSLNKAFLLQDKDLVFKKSQIGQKIVFVYEDSTKRITKEFNPLNSKYNMELSITIENLSPSPISLDYPLLIGDVKNQNGHFSERLKEVIFAELGKDKPFRSTPYRNFASTGEIKFAAIRDRYFCLVVQPILPGYKGFIKKLNNNHSEVGLKYPLQIAPNQAQRLNFLIYMGPQELQLLESSQKEWGSVIDYGVFTPIARVLLKGLQLLNGLLHNWGLTLILFSLGIYFLLFPLTLKQMRAMKRMQELQPKIEELREKYKSDANEMNKKVMELYREERVNPFSGCLPMLLQIPIFFALYQAVIRAIELKGASFLWIKDLSEPDRMITFAKPLPLIGADINILPILMAGIMFLQQKLTLSSTANTASAEQQRLMMIMFPVLFGVIFYNMPSGLVLYWFVNSLLMLAFQLRMNRYAVT